MPKSPTKSSPSSGGLMRRMGVLLFKAAILLLVIVAASLLILKTIGIPINQVFRYPSLSLSSTPKRHKVPPAPLARKFKIPVTTAKTKEAISDDIKLLRETDRHWPDRKRALLDLSKSDDRHAVEAIILALSDENVFIRCEAAVALGKIKDPRSMTSLKETLTDEGVLIQEGQEIRAVAKAAAAAMRALEDPTFELPTDLCRGQSLASQDLDGDILKLADTGNNPAERSLVATSLGWTKNPKALPPLMKALADKEPFVRAGAAEGLGILGDPRAVQDLEKRLHTDPKYIVREKTALALGRLGATSSMAPLIKALTSDESIMVRTQAASALGKLGDQQAVPALRKALEDRETMTHVRSDGRMKVVRSVVDAAAEALVRLGERIDPALLTFDWVAEDLAVFTNNPSEKPRAKSAWRLAHSGDDRAKEPLLTALSKDASWEVRKTIAKALGDSKDPAVVPNLMSALENDPNQSVRKSARESLEKLQQEGIAKATRLPAAAQQPKAAAPVKTATDAPEIPPESAPEPKKESVSQGAVAASQQASTPPTTELVRIALLRDGFKPGKAKVNLGQRSNIRLSPQKPAALKREPVYKGKERLYGQLTLGVAPDRKFTFAFDQVEASHPLLYFDANQNLDLSDDPGPYHNRSVGIFGSSLFIPFDRLVPEVDLPEKYRTWFFTNHTLWKKRQASHYSWTQLEGRIPIAGTTYDARIVDTGDQDADYTNDGICIDLNRNGEIEIKKEWFDPNKIAWIKGKFYRFEITW